MKFIIRNQANVSNKYIRFSKWKIRKLSRRFQDLIYTEIYIKREANSPEMYSTVVKMGIPGNDIVVSAKSENLKQLWADLSQKMKRQLRKTSNKRYSFNRTNQ